MKTSSFFRYAVIIGSIIFLASCTKEKIQSAGTTNTITTTDTIKPSTFVVRNLVADHWIRNGDGNFSNTFVNLFQSVNSGSTTIRSVTVSIIWGGQEYPVIGKTPFLGGVLETTHNDNDLRIVYHFSSNVLPFSYLNIKVVIEKN